MPYYAIVAAPLPLLNGRESPVTAAFWWVGLAFLLFGWGIGARRMVFQQGPRFTVGLVLLFSCLIIVVVPVISIRQAFKNGAYELMNKTRQDLADQLHQDLERLDNGVVFLFAGLTQRLREISASPALPELLMRKTRPGSASEPVQMLIEQATLPKKFGGGNGAQVVIVTGPNKFQRASAIGRDRSSLAKHAEDAFAPIVRLGLGRLTPRSGGSIDEGAARGKDLQGMKTEEIMNVLIAIFGPDTMLALINNSLRVYQTRVTFARAFMVGTISRAVRGLPEFLFWWVWADWNGLDYLGWHIKNVRPRMPQMPEWCRTFPGLSKVLFSLVGIHPSGAVSPGFFCRVIGDYSKRDMISPGFEVLPPLRESAQQAASGGQENSVQVRYASQTLLIEAVQGTQNQRFILSAMISTFWLEMRERAGLLAVGLFSLLSLAGAVVIAFWGRNRFLSPLSELEAGVERIAGGDFDARLDASRKDEFGTLAEAFNTMARGLEEGRILGQYVSGSVRRAVRNGGSEAITGKGERREVTVLFSGLHGFEEFSARSSSSEVLRELGRHLECFSDAIERYGGEIDKTIGDKVLVVFDHLTLGGAAEAVNAALAVIASVRTELTLKQGLQPAIGLNSGAVVAGILGAPSVRLDYTVIGDAVNLAARLATLAHIAHGSRVVLSGNVLASAAGKLRVQKLPFKRVKGKTQEVEAFLLLDSDLPRG